MQLLDLDIFLKIIFYTWIAQKDQDELHTARLSLAKRFLSYIYEQLEFTPTVADEITKYVNALRELHPGKWEEERLDALSPPSTLDNTWRWVTGIGIGFLIWFYIKIHWGVDFRTIRDAPSLILPFLSYALFIVFVSFF